MKPLLQVALIILLFSCKEPSPTDARIDFSFALEANGKVVFTNLSENVSNLRLSFGDYSLEGEIIDTSHVYLDNDTYTVTLTGKDLNGEVLRTEKKLTIVNRIWQVDTTSFICAKNTLGLKFSQTSECSAYSEFGSVAMQRVSDGRRLVFWYAYRDSEEKHDYSVVGSLIVNDVGSYEFFPELINQRDFENNSVWLRIDRNSDQTLPYVSVARIYKTVQRVRLEITNYSYSKISGKIHLLFDDGFEMEGIFNELEVREDDNSYG